MGEKQGIYLCFVSTSNLHGFIVICDLDLGLGLGLVNQELREDPELDENEMYKVLEI